MLVVEALTAGYGDALVLNNVSLRLEAGEIVCVIGPNGAGKTTLVNAVARLLPLRAGAIRLDDQDVTHLTPQQLAERGVALIPEGRCLFNSMSVEENLEMGAYRVAARSRLRQSLEQVYAMFPVLAERRRQAAGTLSGGQQQMVAIGRALMAKPRLLLVDEPSLGLAPVVIEHVFANLRDIHAGGVAILLIEQNAAKALALSQRAYVLDCGAIVAEGTPADLLARSEINAAYLAHGA